MNIYRPLKAIRLNCLDCCYGSAKEVRLCPTENCPLWPYRFGHRPTREMIENADLVQISTDTRKDTNDSESQPEVVVDEKFGVIGDDDDCD